MSFRPQNNRQNEYFLCFFEKKYLYIKKKLYFCNHKIQLYTIEMTNRNNPLNIDNQLCFPLYAAAKEVVKKYTPYLKPLGLTYTQYITMMILWEEKEVTAAHLGERLYLDSGTLTPMLKKMEQNGLITRKRSDKDERNLMVTITQQGIELRRLAIKVPSQVAQCVNLTSDEAVTLYTLLYKIIGNE